MGFAGVRLGIRDCIESWALRRRICQHSVAVGAVVKLEGKPNNRLERLATDKAFASVDLQAAMEPRKFVGRPSEQVEEFGQLGDDELAGGDGYDRLFGGRGTDVLEDGEWSLG